MPTVAYEVIVGVSADAANSQESAIAEASRYLAYADTTDTFGYFGRIFEVETYGGPDSGWQDDEVLDWGIGLHFTAPVGLQKDKDRFEEELDTLAHVESWEEVHYQPVQESEL